MLQPAQLQTTNNINTNSNTNRDAQRDVIRKITNLSRPNLDAERVPLVRELDDLRPHETV